MKYAISVFVILAVTLAGCKSQTILQSQDATGSNTINVNSARTLSNSTSHDKVIFEGRNNLFELVQKNAAYFDSSHDVIIIKGDNNIIKLINANIVNINSDQSDTLVIVGSKEKYVMDLTNSIRIKKHTSKVDTIQLKKVVFDTSPYSIDNIKEDHPIRLEYFDSLVSAKFAYSFFSEKLKTGEPKYFHELAEIYLYGLGVNASTAKAIELYEYSAAKDYTPSLIKLGDIYKGRFSVKADKNKSLYFYKRCQELGDSYCDAQVKMITSK